MFGDPTTFILGAGASQPYGYPSGKGLVEKILALHNTFLGKYVPPLDQPSLRWPEFVNELRQSNSPSIDAFLENRREFTDVGKLAIAHVLIECENDGKLFGVDDWYAQLLNKLGSKLDQIPKNRLTILTFNYDRSLEHFLYGALASRFGGGDKIAEALRSLEIRHIYGTLGELPWRVGAFVRGYADSDAALVREAANRLRLIHEAEEDLAQQRFIKLSLNDSTRVYFLGFGFHKENMRLLREGLSGKNPIATFFGFTEVEAGAVKAKYGISRRDYSDKKIQEFLRHDAAFVALD